MFSDLRPEAGVRRVFLWAVAQDILDTDRTIGIKKLVHPQRAQQNVVALRA